MIRGSTTRRSLAKVLVMPMDAFFDVSHLQRPAGSHAFILAGVLFAQKGLAEFDRAWQPVVQGLNGPFRTSICNGGREKPFNRMPIAERQAMLTELAKLTSKTRDAGFTVLIEDSEYEEFKAKNPSIAKHTGSVYTIALISILESVRQYVVEKHPDEKVRFWFEAGTEGEAEAMLFMRRIEDRPQAKEYFRMESHAFVPKEQAIAICAADFLAWEWQRNYREAEESERLGKGGGAWRDNFKLLFPDESAAPIVRQYIDKRDMELRALFNMIYGVHRD